MNPLPTPKVALITGAARRIGAAIAQQLHPQMNLVLHYHTSQQAATDLKVTLESKRPNSVHLIQGDLNQTSAMPELAKQAANAWGRLDVLVNNASSFYPTPVGRIAENHWDDLMGSNLKGPFFLSQAALSWLKQAQGCLINIADIHAQRPLKNHSVYCIAKAGVVMMTQSLARELAPDIRVNAIAPGAILWPEAATPSMQQHILDLIPLKKAGHPEHIAHSVQYLIDNAYITGQVIAVDGGRSIR